MHLISLAKEGMRTGMHRLTHAHLGGGEAHISPHHQLAFGVTSELLCRINDDVMTNIHLQFVLQGQSVRKRNTHIQVPMARHHQLMLAGVENFKPWRYAYVHTTWENKIARYMIKSSINGSQRASTPLVLTISPACHQSALLVTETLSCRFVAQTAVGFGA